MKRIWVGVSLLVALIGLAGTQAQFVDIAKQAGLNDVFLCGSDKSKRYIIETLGGGVALFDYNNDGYLDAFFVTGSALEGFPVRREPTNQLYRNNRDGTFARVTKEAGLVQSGWGQGVCVGDYDNDGFDDLFVTYYGQNHLYHNNGKGGFVDVTEAAGLKQETRWSTGCAFLDYDLDGKLDLFIANYVVFDKERIPLPGASPDCRWKGRPVMCGPRGLPGGVNQLFHNEGNGRFTNVSERSKVATVNNP
jgi:enediyne biosynthesis protein E4